MKGLSECGQNLGMHRNGERFMDSTLEGRGLLPKQISSLAGNSGMRQALRMDSP